MASIVTGTLLKPNGVGLGNQPFSIFKVDPNSRRTFGDQVSMVADSSGTFSLTLRQGLYALVYGNDKLYFRVKDDGVMYSIGDILESFK